MSTPSWSGFYTVTLEGGHVHTGPVVVDALTDLVLTKGAPRPWVLPTPKGA